MKYSLDISKIIPPRISQILHRPRLNQLLKQSRDKKLVLVLAQAAQGKSTLALSYANDSEIPAAWINLGPEDSDAVNLFYLLVHSLQRVLKDTDLSPLLDYPSISLGPREEALLYREWAGSLLQLIPVPVQVIFDGVDRLSPAASAFKFLHLLLEEAPPRLHVLMLSREMPPLNVEALVLKQQARLLGNEELAFTLAETKRFFVNFRKLSLPTDLMVRIHQLTEGWIGGLVLLCDSLDWVPEAQREKYITESLTIKIIGGIFQYYGEKIFSSLPAQVQEFLVKSSILDIVEPKFIKEFTGTENAREILEDLARRNLFVQSIFDKKKGWLFRYHQLFRDFLHTKFKTGMVKEQQENSYIRAASLSEPRGELEAAVKYYLQARAYPRAVSVLEKVGLNLLKEGRVGDLSQWLRALPDDLIQENPWLLFYHYMTWRFTIKEQIFSLHKALSLFETAGDQRGSLLALAYLIEASITRGHASIPPINHLLAQGEALLQALTPGHYPYEQAVLWLQIGFAHYLRSGNPRKGYWACHNSYQLARDLGDIPLQLNALTHAHGALSILGEFTEAEKIFHNVEKLLEKYPFPEIRAFNLIHAAQLYLLKEDLTKAGEVLERAREETGKHGLTYLYPAIIQYDLWLKVALEQYAEAEEIGNSLINLTLAMGNQYMHGVGLLLLGLGYYHKGDYPKAREILERARGVFSSEESRADLHLSFIKTVLSLIAYHLGEAGDSARDLDESLHHFQEISCYLFLKEVHLALALQTWSQGATKEAAAHLQAGIKITQERGYYQSLLLNKEDLLQVCILALELQVEGAAEFASYLLSSQLVELAGQELERLSRHANPKIAQTAWEVRQAIHWAGVPRLLIKTLGGFHLYRGAVPVEEKEWEGNQPRLLLKAIIAQGSGGVPKDLLMEDLWPETPPGLGEKNFKVNLHRLRKALEPGLDKAFGSSYVHLKANLISLNQELCQVDADEFLHLCHQGEKKEEAGDLKGALARYKEAVELYGGDFLAEEPYLSWAEVKREDMRLRFIELLNRMSILNEKLGSLTRAIDCLKRIIQVDPVLEQAYQRLMTLYANRGMRNAALRAYEDCRKALSAELNAEPDEVTQAIYRKILESSPRGRGSSSPGS